MYNIDRKKQKRVLLTKDMCTGKSLGELNYLLGRYCGPNNKILCLKVHKFIIDRETIERHIADLSFEQEMLSS